MADLPPPDDNEPPMELITYASLRALVSQNSSASSSPTISNTTPSPASTHTPPSLHLPTSRQASMPSYPSLFSAEGFQPLLQHFLTAARNAPPTLLFPTPPILPFPSLRTPGPSDLSHQSQPPGRVPHHPKTRAFSPASPLQTSAGRDASPSGSSQPKVQLKRSLAPKPLTQLERIERNETGAGRDLIIQERKVRRLAVEGEHEKKCRKLRGRVLQQAFRHRLSYDCKDASNVPPLYSRSPRDYNAAQQVHTTSL
jgi:hypothetical protein